MDLYARIGVAAFWIGVAVTAIPAIGLLLMLASWSVPQLGIPFKFGFFIFLGGWIVWAFVCPGISRSPETYITRVAMFLFFFPVMYPFVVVLLPWVLVFRSQHVTLQDKITTVTPDDDRET